MVASQEFSLAFSRALGRVVVHVHGPLDAYTADELRHRLFDVIDRQAKGKGNRQVVLDLKEMTLIDPVGMSVLVKALKRVSGIGGELILSGPRKAVTESLRAAGLERFFDITPAWTHPAHGDVRNTQSAPAGWERSN